MNFKAEVFIIHILPNGHFDFGGKIAGHYIFWFLPAHDDLDKSSQGILETANSQTTLIKILSSEKTNKLSHTENGHYWRSGDSDG